MIKKKVKQNKIDVVKLQDLILKALTEEYPNDKLSPGLVISYLSAPSDYRYYVSICRYQLVDKKILFSYKGNSLEQALFEMCKEWLRLNKTKRAKEELTKYISHHNTNDNTFN